MEDKVFKYGSLEVEFDPTDYVQLEAYERAFEDMQQDIAKALSEERRSAQVKGLVLTIAQFLDGVLGDGSSNAALGGSTSLDEAMAAMAALVEYVNLRATSIGGRWQQLSEKYSPSPNRTLRQSRQ